MTEATSQNENSTNPSNETKDNSGVTIESLQKRLSDNQSYAAKKLNEMTAENEALKQKLAQQESKAFTMSKEDLATLAKEDPDAFNGYVASFAEASASFRTDIYNEIKNLKEATMDLGAAKEYGEILKSVPDYEEIRASQEFISWLSQQPPLTQKAFSGEVNATAADLVSYTNTYKTFRDSNKSQQEQESKMKDQEVINSQSVPSGTSPEVSTGGDGKFTPEQIAAFSPAQYAANRDAIMKQYYNI